jgi:hypothetical protein
MLACPDVFDGKIENNNIPMGCASRKQVYLAVEEVLLYQLQVSLRPEILPSNLKTTASSSS